MDALNPLPKPHNRSVALSTPALSPGLAVGIYGGSFNPAHEGHWHVAETARKRLGLDRVWWVVSPQNPLKSPAETSDFAQRVQDVRALIDGRPRHVISTIERDEDLGRTLDTVRFLTRHWRSVHWVWVMGEDNLAGFHRWFGWREIADLVPIAIVSRPHVRPIAGLSKMAQVLSSHRLDESQAGSLVVKSPPAWVYLHARHNAASSTALRSRAYSDADTA